MGKPKSLKDHCRYCKQVIKWGPAGKTYAELMGEEHSTGRHGWNERWHHVRMREPEGGDTPSMRDLIYCPAGTERPSGGFVSIVATPVSFCNESQSNYEGVCNRPIKDKGVCGIHLRSIAKAEREAEERREREEIQNHILSSVEALCQQLEECGVSGAKPHYHPPGYGYSHGHYTGNIVVSPNELLKFLKVVTKKPKATKKVKA